MFVYVETFQKFSKFIAVTPWVDAQMLEYRDNIFTETASYKYRCLFQNHTSLIWNIFVHPELSIIFSESAASMDVRMLGYKVKMKPFQNFFNSIPSIPWVDAQMHRCVHEESKLGLLDKQESFNNMGI